MASVPAQLVDEAVRAIMAPVLAQDGFKGARRTYRRIDGELIQLVQVQGSRYGGEFAVNLAVHLSFLPDALGNPVVPKRITESLCEFRRRMTTGGTDLWWSHGTDSASIAGAVKAATGVYEAHGRRQLAILGSYPDAFSRITASSFIAGEGKVGGFGFTSVRRALAFARIRIHEGNLLEARAFASFALANLGRAVALRPTLEGILSAT